MGPATPCLLGIIKGNIVLAIGDWEAFIGVAFWWGNGISTPLTLVV